MTPRVPAGPVNNWIRTEVVPCYGSLRNLARVLAARTGTSTDSWYRFFIRLALQPTVTLWHLDKLCTLLGEHVSRFDPDAYDVECEEASR